MAEMVTWDIEPHTARKHEILRRYFQAWLPIMSSWNGRVVYIDGFAGPGRYKNGEKGSPLVVLETARDHSFKNQSHLLCIFVEKDSRRSTSLEGELAKIAPTLPKNISYKVLTGVFDEALMSVFATLEEQNARHAPAFVFIDPFGFSNTPFQTVKRILRYPGCEVLINFMYEEINRFISHPDLAAKYDELFGTTKWRVACALETPDERRRTLHEIYLRQLRTVAKYARSFEMLNRRNRTDYFLFFATNALRGLEKMKEAMWAVDKSGTFQFSDYTDALAQRPLFREQPDYLDLRARVTQRFKGKRVAIDELADWVVAETPYLRTHIKTNVLKPMEADGELLLINSKAARRKGTFPDGSILQFH